MTVRSLRTWIFATVGLGHVHVPTSPCAIFPDQLEPLRQVEPQRPCPRRCFEHPNESVDPGFAQIRDFPMEGHDSGPEVPDQCSNPGA
jgi:hypothetical protein